MTKIKVLYVIDTLEGYGAEKSLVEIASNFKDTRPIFVHIYQGDMLKPTLEDRGIKVYSLDLVEKYAFNKAVEKLKVILDQEKPDIIHATLFRSEIIARKLKSQFPEICLVGSFVSNAYSTARYKEKNLIDRLKLNYFFNLDKKWAPYVDYFISNSHHIKKVTGNALGIQDEKIKVIHRGRASKDFLPEKECHKGVNYKDSNKINLLNVSRLIPLKGQMDLIRGLSKVRNELPNVKLLFAGSGPYRNSLERETKKLALQNNITFLGRIENINKLLQQADFFVYPSYSEGLPGALIEAMMAEKIIFASDIPENLECVNEETAVIFKKGDVDDLSEKLIMVLKNPQKFTHLGIKARKKAIEQFEIENISQEYEKSYVNFIAEKGKSKLRILHLIQKPQNRGAETFAAQLANRQNKIGQKVLLVSVFSGSANLSWEDEILTLNGNISKRFLDYKAWKKLSRIINQFKPDIIQANAGDTLKYAVFSKLIFRWNVPIVFRNASEVGQYLNSNFQKGFNTFLYKSINQVISVSQASKLDLLNHFPFLKGKIRVIPIGLEQIDSISPVCLKPQGVKHIIHVGGFSFEKNHSGLIRIFENFLKIDEQAHLHLIGDGPLRQEVENLVRINNLSKKVSFYGFVNNPLSYIKAGDVLVLPSIIEGLPGVLLEAMYCRTPVIAYNVGGISEIVTRETGELIPKNDVEKFVNAISRTFLNKDGLKIDRAKNMVDNNYMNSTLVKEFNVVYEEVLNK